MLTVLSQILDWSIWYALSTVPVVLTLFFISCIFHALAFMSSLNGGRTIPIQASKVLETAKGSSFISKFSKAESTTSHQLSHTKPLCSLPWNHTGPGTRQPGPRAHSPPEFLKPANQSYWPCPALSFWWKLRQTLAPSLHSFMPPTQTAASLCGSVWCGRCLSPEKFQL